MLLMSADEIRLARKLLREFVFKPLPTVVGRRLRVKSVADFGSSADLLPLVDLEGELKTPPGSLQATLIKYGFVDLRFRLTQPTRFDPARANVVSHLFGEGGIDRSAETKFDREDRIDHLEMMLEEIAEGELEMTVFAEGAQTRTRSVAERRSASRGFTELPADTFPQEFRVTDAYITNAPSIGLLRNFYM